MKCINPFFLIFFFLGDVVVGWISGNTGKGGLDDYFLAGKSIPCDDGAESCPDKSKGGTKDIDLLNAVSRANYTMLTLQRPIKARISSLFLAAGHRPRQL